MIIIDFDTIRPAFVSWWEIVTTSDDSAAHSFSRRIEPRKEEMRWPVSLFDLASA